MPVRAASSNRRGEDMDVSGRIAAMIDIAPAEPAVSYLGEWTTWGGLAAVGARVNELITEARAGADGLRVGLVMRNRPGHVATILDVIARARCLEPISMIQSDAMVAAEVGTLGLTVLVADTEDWQRPGLRKACQELGVLGISLPAGATPDPAAVMVVTAAGARPAASRPGVAVWMSTSGTTGPPKRIPLTYEDISIGFDRIVNYSGGAQKALTELALHKGTTIVVTPLMHIAGLWGIFQFALEGRKLALLDRFEAGSWADLVAAHQPILANLPPAAIRMVLDAEIDPAKLSSLRALASGTAPLPPEVAEAFQDRFGMPVLTSYGATEFPGGLVGWSLPDHKQFNPNREKRGSAGRARPGVEIRVADPETNAVLPPDTPGIIEARTGQTIRRGGDGWVRTTDLGYLDADGFLWVTGRADGAINRGGFKIVPEIIERALEEHPDVRQACAVGLPDERLGQVPVAAVESDADLSEEDLIGFVRERLQRYQIPVRVMVVKALPRTESFKASKPGVRELFGAS
jgi:acyl-CoA synthetase (AMP-forming)/AMP-acid ligase II